MIRFTNSPGTNSYQTANVILLYTKMTEKYTENLCLRYKDFLYHDVVYDSGVTGRYLKLPAHFGNLNVVSKIYIHNEDILLKKTYGFNNEKCYILKRVNLITVYLEKKWDIPCITTVCIHDIEPLQCAAVKTPCDRSLDTPIWEQTEQAAYYLYYM